MARVPTEIKRLVVRVLAKKVADGESPSLEEILNDLALARFEVVSTGEIVVSRSGDGFSGTFAIPSAGAHDGVTPGQMAALMSELLDLRNKADAFLTKLQKYGLDEETVDEDGWPSPLPAIVDANPAVAEADLAVRMLSYLVPKTQSMSDFSQCGVQGAYV